MFNIDLKKLCRLYISMFYKFSRGDVMWFKGFKSDDAFFEELCNQYFMRVYNYCNKILRGQEQDIAEECTQITFLEARKQISKLRKYLNVEAWLYKTSRNQINMMFRKLYVKRKHEIPLDENMAETLSTLDNNLENLIENDIDIEQSLPVIIKQLNNQEYTLYIDYFKEQLTIADLALKYSISTTAVTTRIYRLKKKLTILVYQYLEKI